MGTSAWGGRRTSATLAVVAALGLVAAGVGCGAQTNNATGGAGSTPATAVAVAPDLTSEKSAGPPQAGGKLSMALAAETNGWNPFQGQWTTSSYIVANTIFDPLAAYDPKGKVEPYLAESITPNANFTEWRIKVRAGVKFHNGEPLDSAAIKANLEFGRTSGLTAQAFVNIVGVETADGLTTVVKTNKPWSTFPLTMTGQPGFVAAPAMLADVKNGGNRPIGTGPFTFIEWQRDSRLQVRKNPDYWRKGLPYLDSIDFKVLPDAQSRAQALESKTVDAIESVTPDALLNLQEQARSGSIQMITNAGRDTDETIIALNTEKEPFNDRRVREALAIGLNQDDLAETSYDGAYPSARGPLAKDSPFYLSPDDAGYPKFDLAKAKKMVADYTKEVGHPPRFTAILPPDPAYSRIAQALQSQAQEAGVEVTLQTVEQAKLITTVLTGDYQASGFSLFSAPSMDAAYPFIATKPVAGLSLNFTRNDNPRITAAMDAARATDDPAKQREQYQIVQRELAKDLDKIFLVHPIGGIAYSNQIHGFMATNFPDTQVPAASGKGVISPFTTAVWVSR